MVNIRLPAYSQSQCRSHMHGADRANKIQPIRVPVRKSHTSETKMASLDGVLSRVASKFKISALNAHQMTAIRALVERKTDVFVNLPTGFGKSLIYQVLPTVFNDVNSSLGHIVVVVSPLVNLMDDQVRSLTTLGIRAVNITSASEEEKSDVEKGHYSVVYGSPEAWLKNERWRDMLHNEVFSHKLCAIAIDEAHVLRQWGTSQDNKMAAFREWYGRLYELRALTSVRVVALTATATCLTRDTILKILHMDHFEEIKENPNKPNIRYSVHCMDKTVEHEEHFRWIADEIKEKGQEATRSIIYCQTIKQCGMVYATIRSLVGRDFLYNSQGLPYVEMMHSCTPESNKAYILESFQQECGTVRLLVATIAFGMGVDCKGVKRVIHYGPSKNAEAYVQETGRAGRDGSPCEAFILYHGVLLSHVDSDMKAFVKSKQCRRKELMRHFSSEIIEIEIPHNCCDICAATCDCQNESCDKTAFPVLESDEPEAKRTVTVAEKHNVESALNEYHKTLVVRLLKSSAHGDIKTLTELQFILGFSEHQIMQVLDNMEFISNISDVYKFVEIWDKQHAHKILSVLSVVFQDISCDAAIDDESIFHNTTILS